MTTDFIIDLTPNKGDTVILVVVEAQAHFIPWGTLIEWRTKQSWIETAKNWSVLKKELAEAKEIAKSMQIESISPSRN